MARAEQTSPRSAEQVAADEERLAELADALLRSVDAVVAGWVESLVIDRARAGGHLADDQLVADAGAAGEAARRDLLPKLRELLEADVDEQAANPLELLRVVTRHASDVLERAGVPAVERDHFAVQSFPSDVYDLAPATWADVHSELHEAGIAWGAAKAYVHRARRRDEGMT